MKRTTVSAIVAAALLLLPATALADDINGTPSDDVLQGTPDPDNIWGRGQDDVIFGLEGEDNLFGNAGNDLVCGHEDEDDYWGGWGNDLLSEFILCDGIVPLPDGQGEGRVRPTGRIDGLADRMRGNEGGDFIEGSDGNDRIHGGIGSENITLFGFTLPLLYGGFGDDTISGGRESDGIQGDAGSDTLYGNRGFDFIDSAENDLVGDVDFVDCGPHYDEAVVNENDTVINCEEVTEMPDPTLTSADQTSTERQDRAREEYMSRNGMGSEE